jgi:hypothetical protein
MQEKQEKSMANKTTRILFRVLLSLFLAYGAMLSGCTPAAKIQKEIRVSIEQNPDWKIAEKCADDDCTMLVDFLAGKNMTIRVELDNDPQTKLFFIIRTEFTALKYQAQYTPANIRVRLKSGEILKPKVFTCFYTISDLEYLRARPSLDGSFLLNKLDCYLLFFDHPALTAGDEVVMNMNEAFTINGKGLDVPLVRFRKDLKAP